MNSKLVEYSPQAIANIQTVEEAKDGYEKLKALVSYFRDDYDQAFSVSVSMIECACRGGELIKEGQENGELASKGRPEKKSQPATFKLSEVGLNKSQSSRWQRMALVDEIKREEYYDKLLLKEELPTIAGVLRLGDKIKRKRKHEEDMDEFGNKKYRIIYADPPWKYGNTMPEYATEQADHYELMTIDELIELKLGADEISVKEIAYEDAVLFLWVTSPVLEDAFKIINAWGFKYKASFIWDKIKHNMGHYNSVRHELLLICTRGSCTPDVQKLFDSVQSIERSDKHSEKPEEFRKIIETLYTYGNKIELFSRKQTEGWDTFGNEKRISEATTEGAQNGSID